MLNGHHMEANRNMNF